MTAVAAQFLGDFEGFLDTALVGTRKIDMNRVLPAYKMTAADVDMVKEKIAPRVAEMEKVVAGDEDLVEGWTGVAKSKRKEILAMYQAVMNFEVKRKPRKTKAKSMTKSGSFVSSTKPAASEKTVFALVPKYRMIMVYENATVTGNKVDFTDSFGVQLPAGSEISDVKKCASEAEALAFVGNYEQIKNKPSSTLSKFVTETFSI